MVTTGVAVGRALEPGAADGVEVADDVTAVTVPNGDGAGAHAVASNALPANNAATCRLSIVPPISREEDARRTWAVTS
jgi:hypothetical protein